MKQRLRQIGFFLLLSLAACTFSSQRHDFDEGEKALAESHRAAAFPSFVKAAHGSDQVLALSAARKAARLAQVDLKKYQDAIDLYRFIIVASDSDMERKNAQKSIAQIYFENLLYYDKAIIEYEKLLQLDITPAEKYQFRLNIAKCQHQLGNLDQALAEIDALALLATADNDAYDLQVFKSNVLMSQKKQLEASQILETLIKKYPERAQKEGLPLTLAVCYEEVDEFKKAITILEAMKKGYPHPEFLETRIERLRARMSNLPLANGFKK